MVFIHTNSVISTYLSTMNPQTMKHHIIIVHYGNEESTRRLVGALLGGKRPPDTVVVVNNDDSAIEDLGGRSCVVVRPGRNVGFGAGFNVGLGVLYANNAKQEDIVTCVNNDVAVTSGFFAQVRDWWEKNTQDVLVGFETKQGSKRHVWGVVNLFTGRSCLLPADVGDKKKKWWEVWYIHGALFSSTYGALIDNHGMGEDYFMYWEDVLLSKGVSLKGLALKAAACDGAVHEGVKGGSGDKTYYLVRSGALFLERETSRPWCWYWFVLNRARWVYHVLGFSDKPVVVKALRDAIGKKYRK